MLVFLGGGLGSLARWGLQSAATRWTEGVFPFGTLVANLGEARSHTTAGALLPGAFGAEDLR